MRFFTSPSIHHDVRYTFSTEFVTPSSPSSLHLNHRVRAYKTVGVTHARAPRGLQVVHHERRDGHRAAAGCAAAYADDPFRGVSAERPVCPAPPLAPRPPGTRRCLRNSAPLLGDSSRVIVAPMSRRESLSSSPLPDAGCRFARLRSRNGNKKGGRSRCRAGVSARTPTVVCVFLAFIYTNRHIPPYRWQQRSARAAAGVRGRRPRRAHDVGAGLWSCGERAAGGNSRAMQ